MDEYVFVNRANWESRVPVHVASEEYGLRRFIDDPEHLSEVVVFDRPRLGDIGGKDVVHLQCHIGTDTLSLARLGAHVTGLDFSPRALAAARQLAADCQQPIRYVEAEVYDAPAALGVNRFDVVYTGIGALCWLPDIKRWASVVSALLRPGGRLFIREGHPVLWALADPRPDGVVALEYPYFETTGTTFIDAHTYVEHDTELAEPETIGFNHGIGEIITALLRVGMTITGFEEHDSVPWTALGGQMEDVGGGEYRLRDRPERLPATYTLQAVKQ
ncbi:MAG TPA: class I SAM-dependent methyltransferase [Ilumatobacteraceae bacterium]